MLKARTARIHEQMNALAEKNSIEIKKIDIGTPLLPIAKKEFQKGIFPERKDNQIVAIFKQLGYGRCWNFSKNKKVLEPKIRRTYHYTVYHYDIYFGLGSHTINTYLPNNVRGYFNQHNWILQRLKRLKHYDANVKMYHNSFQDIGSNDPYRFQKLCDSITFQDIQHYDHDWIKRLWPELYCSRYRTYINELEYCGNLIFKQKKFLNHFYINRCMAAYELGLPQHLSFLFNRRIDKRYRYPYKTQLKIVATKPSLKLKYKTSQYKEYIKDRDLRPEVTLNNPSDLGLTKQEFDRMRKMGREILEHGMSIQQPVNPDWITQELGHNPFKPVTVKKKQLAGLNVSDERLRSVFQCFSQQNLVGFSMREVTDFVNLDLGTSLESPLKLSQVSYVVRKLRGHGIVEKLEGKNRYQFTPSGHCFARMFVTVIEKVIFPFVKNVETSSPEGFPSPQSREKVTSRSNYLTKLSVLYNQLDDVLYRLVTHVDIDVNRFASAVT